MRKNQLTISFLQMASLSPPTISVPTSWPEKPANATKQATTTSPKPTSSKKPATVTKQAMTTATLATTPSPAAASAMGLASKTPAVKSDKSSFMEKMDKLLLTSEPTEEQIKAWSLKKYGTYRKSNYISLMFCNITPNKR